MTITSDQVSIDQPDVDQRPGSSDIAWAERAYHHQRREPTNEHRRAPRGRRRRLRILVATFAVVLMAGLIVMMRYGGTSVSPVIHQPISSQPATTLQATAAVSPFTVTPPSIRPFLSLPSTNAS